MGTPQKNVRKTHFTNATFQKVVVGGATLPPQDGLLFRCEFLHGAEPTPLWPGRGTWRPPHPQQLPGARDGLGIPIPKVKPGGVVPAGYRPVMPVAAWCYAAAGFTPLSVSMYRPA